MRFKCENCRGREYHVDIESLIDLNFACPTCGAKCKRIVSLLGQKRKRDSEDSSASEPELRSVKRFRHTPVKDVLPRCEFHTRLSGSTTFEMKDSQYWKSYSRSNASRTHDSFDPAFVDTSGISMGPLAKTGTYKNVFSFSDPYRKFLALPPSANGKSGVELKKPPPLPSGWLYQRSLQYRTGVCSYIIKRLKARSCPVIVNADNEYPCLLVQTPGGPGSEEFPASKDKDKLATCQENWTRFVMACFVGIANHLSWGRNLPIELVMRSSFGHLAPSVAECTISIRINVGIIPLPYADVLVEAIEMIHQVFHEDFKAKLSELDVDPSFSQLSEAYFLNLVYRQVKNAKKKEHVDKKAVEALLKQGYAKVKETHFPKSKQRAPRKLQQAENLWKWLWMPGDGSGKSVLTQLVDRKMENLEEFADRVQQALEKGEDLSTVVVPLPQRFKLDTKKLDGGISVESAKLPNMKDFADISKQEVVVVDERFWSLVRDMAHALGGGKMHKGHLESRTVGGLYSGLEQLHLEFMQREGVLQLPSCEDGYGSDSEEEEEFEKGGRIYSKKLITATGMRAIHLAHHCGRHYASEQGLDITNVKVEAGRMYYETEEALKGVPIQFDFGEGKGSKPMHMLFFDLNHCNNIQRRKYPKIDFSKYHCVVLDHTSATPSLVNTYLKAAFRCPEVGVVLLVTSGLKNEQGGVDMNTYGTLRIMTRDKVLRDALYEGVKGVDKTVVTKKKKREGKWKDVRVRVPYKHPAASHAIRRAYKSKGFVPTTRNFLQPGFSEPLWQDEPELLEYQPTEGAPIRFEVIDVEADGDCLFSAIAVGAEEEGPDTVRNDIVKRLRSRKHLVPTGRMHLQVGLGYSHTEVQGQDAYLTEMAKPLVWGGLTEIRAYSFVRPIVVFETRTTPVLFHNGEETAAESIDWANLPGNTLFLAFYGNHYAALKRQ